MFFFYNPKTAYDMLISDWSSDVCSSDLASRRRRGALSRRPEMTEAAAALVERDFAVPDIRCAGCIAKLEQGLVRDRRIAAARVNFTEKRVHISCKIGRAHV